MENRHPLTLIAALALIASIISLSSPDTLVVTEFNSSYNSSGPLHFNATLEDKVISRNSPGTIILTLENRGTNLTAQMPAFPPFGVIRTGKPSGSYGFTLWNDNYTSSEYISITRGGIGVKSIGLLQPIPSSSKRSIKYELIKSSHQISKEHLPEPGKYYIQDTIPYDVNGVDQKLRYRVSFTIERK